MSDLASITALGAPTPASAAFGAIRIEERDDVGLASLARRRGAARPAPWSLTLPDPGQWRAAAGSDAVAAFWTGPDQWMLEAPGQAEIDLARALRQEAPGCSVTEQTDGWVVFEIISSQGAGPLRALMEKLVNVDVDGFGPGSATRTLLEHLSVFVIRRAEERLAVIGPRSSAASLWRALSVAAERLEATA